MNRLKAVRPGPDDPQPSKETLQKAAQVRINVMAGSLQGLGAGLVFGAAGWPLVRRYLPAGWRHTKYHVFTTLTLGALGSFIGSVTATRNSLEHVVSGMKPVVPPEQKAADDAFARRQQALARGADPRGKGDGEGGGFWVLPPPPPMDGEKGGMGVGPAPGATPTPRASATRSF
jgi:hypothetical protein